ncbi:MAG: hypothetical protein ACRYGK_05370 [Janthinobacterium lividum]
MPTTFELQVREFAELAKANAELVVRKVTLDMAVAVIKRSPVGNPELWAENAHAAAYNNEVNEENARRRTVPENLTKNGRLKPGAKLNDGMSIKAPDGYTGGRFRANYFFTLNAPSNESTDQVDPTGAESIGRMTAQIADSAVGYVAYVQNNLPYAERLENGWSKKQAPAGMVGVTVAEFQQFVDKAVAGLKK